MLSTFRVVQQTVIKQLQKLLRSTERTAITTCTTYPVETRHYALIALVIIQHVFWTKITSIAIYARIALTSQSPRVSIMN